MQVCSEGMVEVLQFKVTVWTKVAAKSDYEVQEFQNFLGSISVLQVEKLGGAWV